MSWRMTSLKELNKKKMYTRKQLLTLSKFKGKYLAVTNHALAYWVDGVGYQTVYEVHDMTSKAKENYQSVMEILE